MKLLFLCLVAISSAAFSYDDSQRYQVAKFYKKKIMKVVDRSSNNLKGECRMMLTMNHIDHDYAKLKRVRTTGDSQLCKVAAKSLAPYKNKKIKYDIPEKLLRLTVSMRD
ncbi:hypothetical protein ACGRL8_16130 [Vibrio rumoiensis]|uniref:TonB C-terminal domain-containing protein n=1 Tax=Vibrio rumoiensis TaxID=76258 RepID=A0ABW7IXW7_9VIBR